MGRSLQLPVAPVGNLKTIPPVSKGGTGATVPGTAAANLSLLSSLNLGQAGGALKLGNDGKVPAASLPSAVIQGPTLEGPAEVYVSQSCQFTITNYDETSAYSLTASAGTISRNGNQVTYVAPGSVQTVTLTINGRSITINIRATAPVRPTITSPTPNAQNLTTGIMATASAFALSTGAGTHLSSDWQLATDAAFTSIVSSTSSDTNNKTSWTLMGMLENTRYFLRVRYRDSVNGYSEWSNAVTFVTRASFGTYVEEAVLSHSDRAASDFLATVHKVDMTPDGTRVVLSTSHKTGTYTSQGAVYVFVRTGSSWTQEAKITHPASGNTEQFGWAVAINGTGERIVSSAATKTNTFGNQGVVYIFTRNTSTNVWSQEAVLYHGDPATSDNFGWSVDMDYAGTRVALGARNKTGTQNQEGAVYIFTRSGTTWTQEAKILGPSPAASAWLGGYVALSADGSRMVTVGQPGRNAHVYLRTGTTWALEASLTTTGYTSPSSYYMRCCISDSGDRIAVSLWYSTSTVTAQGLVLVFARTGSSWAQEAILTLTSPVAYDQFGSDVSMNADGTILAVGCNRRTISTSAQGAVFVYVRSGTNWTLRSTHVASNAQASANFGDAVAISDDGTRLVVGAPNATLASLSNSGGAYVFA